jgi:hypothetical protein
MRQDGCASTERVVHRIRQLHPDFQRVLAHYIDGSSSELTELAERWITGTDATKQTATRLKVGLRPTDEHALAMLRELGSLSRSIGFAGIVILLDEAEAIPSYARSADRAHCYANLCRLMSPDFRVPGCYFVYATTPAFFEHAGDLPLSRDSRQVISLTALTEPEAAQLGRIIRDLYVIGEGIQTWYGSVDDSQVAACARQCFTSTTQGVRPRAFVRSLVSSLDICAQNARRRLADVFSWCET